MNKKQVVVTGATSFLGSATVRALLEAGCRVAAVIRPGSENLARLPKDHPDLMIVPAPLFGSAIVKSMVVRCEAWYHFGWGATTPELRNDASEQHQNVYFSLQALETAAGMGANRFVFAGSQAEYGVHPEQITEKTPCHPVSEYGKAKLNFGSLGAATAGALKIGFTHLRIFSVYGEGDHAFTLLPTCARAFLQGEDMPLSDCTQKWNYLHITDFADLMLRILLADPAAANGVFNVAGSDTRPLKEYVEEFHGLCGGLGRPVYGEAAQKPEGAVQLDPDIHKAMSTFRWEPRVSFREGAMGVIEEAKRRIQA